MHSAYLGEINYYRKNICNAILWLQKLPKSCTTLNSQQTNRILIWNKDFHNINTVKYISLMPNARNKMHKKNDVKYSQMHTLLELCHLSQYRSKQPVHREEFCLFQYPNPNIHKKRLSYFQLIQIANLIVLR